MYSYESWLVKQTTDRIAASITHMRLCKAYGEVARTEPRSEFAKFLQKKITDYHAHPKA